jgi:hypothetical protein
MFRPLWSFKSFVKKENRIHASTEQALLFGDPVPLRVFPALVRQTSEGVYGRSADEKS